MTPFLALLPFYYTILQCYMSDYRESGPPGIQNRGPGTPGSGRRDPDLGPLHVMFKNKSEGARSYNRPQPHPPDVPNTPNTRESS